MIVQMDDAEATIVMVDSNLQREHIKPSEKAYAYKMKLEAMKQQGKKITEPISQVGTRLSKDVGENGKSIFRSDELLAKRVGESRNQIARYIHLTSGRHTDRGIDDAYGKRRSNGYGRGSILPRPSPTRGWL